MPSIRADFREGDEDSNFSVIRVRRFSEWPDPLHWNCLSCRNTYQTPHSLNCLPLFHWKSHFFHRKVLRRTPFPKIGSDSKSCDFSWGAADIAAATQGIAWFWCSQIATVIACDIKDESPLQRSFLARNKFGHVSSRTQASQGFFMLPPENRYLFSKIGTEYTYIV